MEWPDNLVKGLGMDPSNYNRDGLFAALALLPFWPRKFITLHYKNGWTEEGIKSHYKYDLATNMAKGLDLLSNRYRKYLEYKTPEPNTSDKRTLNDIGLSVKTYNALKRRFNWLLVVDIDRLNIYTWNHLHEVYGLGEVGYWEVFKKLQEYGVHLKETLYIDRDFPTITYDRSILKF